MNRNDFLTTLMNALENELPPQEIKNNIEYYNHYFDTELQEGKSEEEILSTLGDPRLIAHTILDTYKMSHQMSWNIYHEQEEPHYDESIDFDEYSQTNHDTKNQQVKYTWYSQNSIPWYYKLGCGVLFLLVIILLISIVFHLFLYVGIPLILICFIIAIINRWKRK